MSTETPELSPADIRELGITTDALEETKHLQRNFGRKEILFFTICTLVGVDTIGLLAGCLLYTSPSPRDLSTSRMPSSA